MRSSVMGAFAMAAGAQTVAARGFTVLNLQID
jgi:hypothetical protein